MSLNIKQPETDDDFQALAHIHIEGWRAAYKGVFTDEYLNSLSLDEKAKKWKKWASDPESEVVMAYENNQPVGFISYGRLRTPPPGQSAIRPLYTSEIMAIYILPEFWGQGVGKALMKYAVESLQELKHQSLCLWVLDANKRACQFYEALDGTRIGKTKVEIGGKWVKEVCYGWRHSKEIISS